MKIQRGLWSLVLLSLFIWMPSAMAERVVQDGVIYDIQNGQARVVDYDHTADTVIFHAEIQGAHLTFTEESIWLNCGASTLIFSEGITHLPDYVFNGYPRVETLIFPSTLRSLGTRNFQQFNSLRQVELPEGLVSVGIQCFSYCSALERITLPSTLSTLEESCFTSIGTLQEYIVHPANQTFSSVEGSLCSRDGRTLYRAATGGATSWSLPQGLNSFDPHALAYDSPIQELYIPEGMETIVGLTLHHCSQLKRLYLPSSLQFLEEDALPKRTIQQVTVAPNNAHYYDVDGVLFRSADQALLVYTRGKNEHYDVPPGTQAIASYAFSGDRVLKSITLPLSLRAVPMGAFASCTSLESVSLPLTLEEIDDYAFATCIALNRIALPPGLQRIGEGAFHNCPSLTQLALPDGLVSISGDAFSNGPNLTLVASPGTVGEDFARTPETYTNYGILVDESSAQGLLFASVERPAALVNNAETDARLHLRAQESTEAQSLGRYPNGTTVIPQYWTDTWCYVQIGQEYGFMMVDYLMFTEGLQSQYRARQCTLKPAYARQSLFMDPVSGGVSLGDFLPGEQADVVSSIGTWYEIRVNGILGYVPANTVNVIYDAPNDGRSFGVVANPEDGDRLHLRAKASSDGESLGRYFNGTHVEITGESGDWYAVSLDGKTGYMMKKFVDRVTLLTE